MSDAYEDLAKYHERDCSRYANGQCYTRRCLIRGGYKIGSGPVDYSLATCEVHETILALRRLAAHTSTPNQAIEKTGDGAS